MFDALGRFVVEDYSDKPAFASFLPGIAGKLGVPLWCYYVNRGQGVCSFGARDKDHAVMEFSPAYTAYRDTAQRGFRTFVKADGAVRELFCAHPAMHIGMSELEITDAADGLECSALYFGVPNERAALLARVLTLRNIGDKPMQVELLDGMPEIVPYGVGQDSLKNMANLAQAWMQAEDVKDGLAYFRVRASMADSAIVTEVNGGSFALAWNDAGERISPFVRQQSIFGEDTAFRFPSVFATQSLDEMSVHAQFVNNHFTCCFMPLKVSIPAGGTLCLRSLYGQAEDKKTVRRLAETVDEGWFCRKREELRQLIDELCTAVGTRTADPMFDAYSRQTYLDNLLRGGAPMMFESDGRRKPFYLYSRKHGDPEREYNYFSLGDEYYAQGNGNYRDVNQNRRCDVLFEPRLGAENVHTFYELIQIDGYNPLVLTAATYRLPDNGADCMPDEYAAVKRLLLGDFTPGQLAMALESAGVPKQELPERVARIICECETQPNADYGEGYWCDHWTYNLDQIESYLAVWPEKKRELLFEDASYRWYRARAMINPRAKRYRLTPNGLRQYNAVTVLPSGTDGQWLCDERGEPVRSTPIEKLLLLCAIKTATLDAAGMGVEMEGGKPGWYDALNGLPGLLGSSMAESCELLRLLRFTSDALREQSGDISLHAQIAELLQCVSSTAERVSEPFKRWEEWNQTKEAFRAETSARLSGKRVTLAAQALADMLKPLERAVSEGIDRAVRLGGGICPTYFTFEATELSDTPDGILPTGLTPTVLPPFLEAPVRLMKLPASAESKRELARRIRESGLYDKALKMYKVNAPLEGVSYEAGRAKAFTPGWLENESVWLHMEYKYLLELLKSGLYDEFAQAFHDAAVVYLPLESYGRSPLENVSFIASSANPDTTVRGRGFVARLSGSTAEFLQMWQLMFIGERPFRMENGELCLTLAPFVPQYLMPGDGCVGATLLGSVAVTYHAMGLPRLMPGETRVREYVLHLADGGDIRITGTAISGGQAEAVRAGRVASIEAYMEGTLPQQRS